MRLHAHTLREPYKIILFIESESTGRMVAKVTFHFYNSGAPDSMEIFSEHIVPVLFDPITENVRELIKLFGTDGTFLKMLEKLGEDERTKIL